MLKYILVKGNEKLKNFLYAHVMAYVSKLFRDSRNKNVYVNYMIAHLENIFNEINGTVNTQGSFFVVVRGFASFEGH